MAELKTNLNIVWNGGKTGKGTLTADYLETDVAIPTALGGSGNGTDPKELLVSSATTCYIATLTYMLETRKLPVVELTINTAASVSNTGFNIAHAPQIVLAADATEDHVQSAERAIEGADKSCEVGNLLKKAGVVIEVQGKVSLK
ncbi:OsmC family protein [Sporosarcina sp. ACRSM]|uniref:OsmC family protein n=1 Tax=Sporosarcina sp. ACRSM TaxID=2918216 RepID=UPI001EF56365|nr:OsmC family protein [Sporosarcina sp. ACRSM]MCG7334601.1 OsmC family protein [Sporosarcina sp. ACRSM]